MSKENSPLTSLAESVLDRQNRTELQSADFLQAVEVAIQNRPVCVENRWAICWHLGGIRIWPANAMYQKEILIWILTDKQATEGLNAAEWSIIGSKIRRLITQTKTPPAAYEKEVKKL